MEWYSKYIGTKFKEKGRDASGVDCWGLVYLVYKNELGIELPSYIECYNSSEDKEVLSSLILKESENKWVEVTDATKLKPYDVIVLRMDGFPFHVGLCAHDSTFIHCGKGFNTVQARIDSMHWKRRVMGVFRWEI